MSVCREYRSHKLAGRVTDWLVYLLRRRCVPRLAVDVAQATVSRLEISIVVRLGRARWGVEGKEKVEGMTGNEEEVEGGTEKWNERRCRAKRRGQDGRRF